VSRKHLQYVDFQVFSLKLAPFVKKIFILAQHLMEQLCLIKCFRLPKAKDWTDRTNAFNLKLNIQ